MVIENNHISIYSSKIISLNQQLLNCVISDNNINVENVKMDIEVEETNINTNVDIENINMDVDIENINVDIYIENINVDVVRRYIK
ncbi:18189_t:CDS:1, partial [Gigaspora margarita]